MHRHLTQVVKGAEDDVIREPHDHTPTGPVAATPEKHSTNNCKRPDRKNEDESVLEGASREFGGMIAHRYNAHGRKETSDDADRNRTFVHLGFTVRILNHVLWQVS